MRTPDANDTRARELEGRRALGARVRDLRRARGLNQDEFAALASIQRSHMGLIENGRVDVRFSTILRMAWALEIDPAEFVAGHESDPDA